ncbi:hypothetical protein F4780DRAFT_792202 [Xylariomycetidae sp. FL0641]|nr:hypothetical protein F4780DRAFT_792202 [Xylariomycetidae sp. FL0641]
MPPANSWDSLVEQLQVLLRGKGNGTLPIPMANSPMGSSPRPKANSDPSASSASAPPPPTNEPPYPDVKPQQEQTHASYTRPAEASKQEQTHASYTRPAEASKSPEPEEPPQTDSQKPQKPQKSQKPQTDGKAYYGYLFNADKTPTNTLNALLHAIGQYIIDNIGESNVGYLDPKKLSHFYHLVGGDYDALFVKAPSKSISYIWQALGVRHNLVQPCDNAFAEPTIPALTLEGFARWETIQILLGPEEHVPFLQYAVANWPLKRLDTGETFPSDLPSEAFPAECDADIDRWHRSCGERLRQAATPKEDPSPGPSSPEPRIHKTYVHVHSPPSGAIPRSRPEDDYFSRERPVPYAHVSGSGARFPGRHFMPNMSDTRRGSSTSSSSDDLPRRRSYQDMRRRPVEEPRPSAHVNARRPPAPTRHSHPRPEPEVISDLDIDEMSPRLTPRARPHNGHPSFRRMPAPVSPSAAPVRPRPEPRIVPSEDPRRLSLPAQLRQKVDSFLHTSADRHRSRSREKPPVPVGVPPVRYRKDLPRSRLSRSASGDSYRSDDSDDLSPRYTPSSSRERVRARERLLEKERARAREVEEERDRRKERERYLRPAMHRRTSSHADADRRMREAGWDSRDRGRNREWERGNRRILRSDERDRSDRRYKDRVNTQTGVTGRRYVN